MTLDLRRQRRRRRRSALPTVPRSHHALRLYVALDIGLIVVAAVLLWLALRMRQPQPASLAAAATPEVTTPALAPTRVLVSSINPTAAPMRPAVASVPATPTRNPVYTLTLSDIFPPRNIDILHLDPQRLRTVIVTGDVVPARSTDAMIRDHGDNFLITVSATKDILSAGDLTIVNLEAPLIKDCPRHESGFTMCGRPGFVGALTAGGVDVVTLENNHIWNFNLAGVLETKKNLEAAKLTWVDRDHPATKDVRGVKFGVVAVNGVGAKLDRKAFVAQLRAMRPKVDVLVAAIHWGAEYVAVPEKAPGIADDNPFELAHLSVDAGCDLVIGNHPHWVQGVELYKGKLITYAHGNFIFDQMWSDETRIGVIGRYTFYDRGLVRVEYLPTMIEAYGKPVPLKGKASQAVLDKMKAASLEIAKKAAANAP